MDNLSLNETVFSLLQPVWLVFLYPLRSERKTVSNFSNSLKTPRILCEGFVNFFYFAFLAALAARSVRLAAFFCFKVGN